MLLKEMCFLQEFCNKICLKWRYFDLYSVHDKHTKYGSEEIRARHLVGIILKDLRTYPEVVKSLPQKY